MNQVSSESEKSSTFFGRRKLFNTKALLLILALLLAGLGYYLIKTSGLGKVASGKKELTLTVSAGWTDAIYQRAIEVFEKRHPDVKIRLISIGGRYYQKVLVMIAGGVAPDLMWMGESFSEFAERDVFLDISDRIRHEKIDLSEYPAEVLRWYSDPDGKIYSLPFGVDFKFLAYNLKLFREAGVPEPADDWTYDEFLHAAQKLTKRDGNGRLIRYGFRGSLDPGLFGAAVFDAEGNVTYDSPEMLEYLRVSYDLAHKYRVCATVEDAATQSNDIFGYFRQGKAAIIQLATWRFPGALESFNGMEWKIGLNPKVKKQSQWASSAAICISRTTPYPDAAWEFLKICQEEEFQMDMSTCTLPARRRFAEKAVTEGRGLPPNCRVMLRALDFMAPTPRIQHLQELMAVASRFNGKVFTGRSTPTEAMRECADELRRRIKRFEVQRKVLAKQTKEIDNAH